jgi:hypothetical protein
MAPSDGRTNRDLNTTVAEKSGCDTTIDCVLTWNLGWIAIVLKVLSDSPAYGKKSKRIRENNDA